MHQESSAAQCCSFSVYEPGQPSHCQGGGLAMLRSILRLWVWFLETMLIKHQPTNWKPPFLIFSFFLFSVRYDRHNGSKKYRRDQNLSIKKYKAVSHFVRTCGPNTRLNVRRKTVTLGGASQKCHFAHFFCRYHLTYKELNLDKISWYVANWAMEHLSRAFRG